MLSCICFVFGRSVGSRFKSFLTFSTLLILPFGNLRLRFFQRHCNQKSTNCKAVHFNNLRRASFESFVVDYFTEINNMPPKKKGATKTAKKATNDAKSKKAKEVIEETKSDHDSSEEKDEEVPKVEEAPKRSRKPAKKVKESSSESEHKQEDSTEEKSEEEKETKKKSQEKPAKSKAAKSKKEENGEVDDDVEEAKPKGRGRKAGTKNKRETDDEDNKIDEPESKKVKKDTKQPMNKTDSDLNEINYGCDKLNEEGEKYNLKITCWNVSGIRALIKKNGADYFPKEDADIIALQETKCDQNKLPSEVKLPGYERYFLDSKKSGYCGVALYSKIKPIEVKYGIKNSKCNDEGRIITAEYEKFYLVNVYVPNAGQKLVTMPKRLEWNEDFKKYIKELDAKKPVIICGDMNVAHQEIDLKNPKTNTKNAGFTKEERDGMTDFLAQGFVDTFRKLYPDKKDAYTFWSYFQNSRSKNIGWRLDYFLVSERISKKVCDNVIRDKIYGSDHCPIVLYITI